jgi:hypothetical protein
MGGKGRERGRGEREVKKERKKGKGGGGIPKYATAAAFCPRCFNNALDYLSLGLSLFTSAEGYTIKDGPARPGPAGHY